MGNIGVECVEALATRGGIKFALEGHVVKLLVESYNKRVIDALTR